MNKARTRILGLIAGGLISAGAAGCGAPTAGQVPAAPVSSPAATAEQSQQTRQTNQGTKTPRAETPPPSQSSAATGGREEAASAGTALAQLETIPIKGRAPKTGYDRDRFGYGWMDPDHNGCDGRNICTL